MLQQHKTAHGNRKIHQRHRQPLPDTHHPCQHRPQPNRRLQQPAEHPPTAPAIILADENRHRVVEIVHIAYRTLPRALTLIVHNARRGKIIIPVASQHNAPRKVHILAVHEISLVQAAYFFVHLPSEHQVRTAHDIHLRLLILADMPHIIGRHPPRTREKVHQATHLVERSLRRRKTTLALLQEPPFAIHHLHTQTSAVGVSGNEIGTLHKRLPLHNRVRIQQQQQF